MTNSPQKENLTEVGFWDHYWATCPLPSEVQNDRPFERCLSNALKKNLENLNVQGKVLEVGCAPGKWLGFLAKTFGLEPHGIEYSEAGMKATMKNMDLLSLESTHIRNGDFFKIKPEPIYNLVISLGFIEHFDDVDSVIERHIDWLRPGGILVLGVPNFKGINEFIQGILNQDILDKHYLDIMNLKYFDSLTQKFNLDQKFLKYIGSYDPILAIGSQEPPSKLQFLTNIFLQITKIMRKFRGFDYLNSRLFSSYILSIYEHKK